MNVTLRNIRTGWFCWGCC